MPLPRTFTGWSSLSIMASPHFAQMRSVRWLASSRFASEARAVFESSPFLAMNYDPFRLFSSVYLDFSWLTSTHFSPPAAEKKGRESFRGTPPIPRQRAPPSALLLEKVSGVSLNPGKGRRPLLQASQACLLPLY